MKLQRYKDDPYAFTITAPVRYGRPRPFRTEDGRTLIYGHDPVWGRENVELAHLTPALPAAPDQDLLRTLILKRVSAVEYHRHDLNVPENEEAWFDGWSAAEGLTYARVEDAVALVEAFPSVRALWMEEAFRTVRQVVARGTWVRPNHRQIGRGDPPDLVFPTLCAKGRYRNDSHPNRAILRSLTAGEAFGFWSLFHFFLFATRAPTSAP